MEKFILIKLTKMAYSKEVKNINNFEKIKVKKVLQFRKKRVTTKWKMNQRMQNSFQMDTKETELSKCKVALETR